MHDKMCKAIYSWGYLGYAPFAPGTVGTIGAIPLVLLLNKLGANAYFLIMLPMYFIGRETADYAEAKDAIQDPKYVVIDEVFGFLITMFMVVPSWQNLLLGFVLFRIFDIFKPFPISWLDKNIKGGHGVMLDDVLAGLMACLSLHLLAKYISF